MHKTHRTTLAISIATVLGIALLVAVVMLNRSGNSTQTNDAPTQADAICRADGEFVGGFMSPQAEDHQTTQLLEQMNTDAITFGGRIEPVDSSDYPDEVTEAIGERQAYTYTVEMHWEGADLSDTDTVVDVGDTEYGIIVAGDNGVVVTESQHGNDPFDSLTRVSQQRDNNALIGLPVPQMRTSGQTWLPDNSYADVVDSFAKKFVQTYHDRGADGFYLAMEMPLTNADHWDPVTEYYGRQTKIINNVSDGATVLISPYLEGRDETETITPDAAVHGYEKLLELEHGTRVLVSPQDGLGVGTTALERDDSEDHRFSVEEYFEALHQANPERLYVTVEAMRPGDGSPDTRAKTSRERVEAQLDATEPYVNGAIGFQWAGPNTMAEIPHIGDGACSAGPNALE